MRLREFVERFDPAGQFYPDEPQRYIRAAMFYRYIRFTETCWEWTASLNWAGYGLWATGASELGASLAHRQLFKAFGGEVATHQDLDHLCRNRRCVRPDHLEPVTRQENVRRGLVCKRECPHGHLYVPENRLRNSEEGWTRCRECANAYQRTYRKRERVRRQRRESQRRYRDSGPKQPCATCGGSLPSTARTDARYCGQTCKQRAYRKRKQEVS